MLRRVPKHDTCRDHFEQPDPIDYCLLAWQNWMSTGGSRNLDARVMSGLVGGYDGYGVDINEDQHSHDMKVGEATDAMISGLSQLHRWAIYRACGQARVWRFPNADFVQVLPEARAALEVSLKKNECTRNFF